MAITELQRKIIARCESTWFSEGRLPTPEVLRAEFNLTSRALNDILGDELVQKSFEARGIPIIEGRSLTPEQITAINTILNFADTRSEKKKLQDMKISPGQWNGWRQNPAFKEYLLNRSEGILGDSIPDVHLALVDRARNGDLGAIKMVYEMTGRYKADGPQMDPKALLNKVFEIISRHVQDQNALLAISSDFAQLAGIATPDSVVNEPPVAGVVVPQEITGGF